MAISHVIRGADHLGNTAFQIALYRALGEAPPAFAHVPLIVGAGGKKLSKRRDPVSVENYREEGYLPEALLNWLVRIGWSHGDQEIFSTEEIQQLFDLDAVNRSAAQADKEKLGWLNQHYIKELPLERLVEELLPFLEKHAAGSVKPSPELARLADLLRERSRTLAEMAERAAFLVVDAVAIEEKARKKFLKPAARPILEDLRTRLAALESWTETALETSFEEVRHAHGDVGMGKLAQPVRVAVTGSSASPGIYETLAILGPARSVARIEAAIASIPGEG
jgi:glutamyl-tRNA synthetase